jgi:MFS family permease
MKFRVLGASIILMMVMGTVYSYGVFRVPIEALFSIGSTESGLPYMTALGFYALFMFFTGKKLHLYKPGVLILIGGGLVALGWVLSSFTDSILLLTLFYGVLGGAGVGIAYGVPISMMPELFPDRKGLATGIVLTGFGLSPLIMAPIAELLIETVGVMQTLRFFGIGFAVILPLISVPYFRIHKDITKKIFKPSDKIRNSKQFIGLYITFTIGTMIGLLIIGLTSKMGIEYVGISQRRVAEYVGVFAIFNGLGRPLFGWLVDHFRVKTVITGVYFIVVLAAVLMGTIGAGKEGIYLFSLMLFWLSLGGWLAIAPTSTLKLFGQEAYARNFGQIFTGYGLGAIIGVTASGAILDFIGSYQVLFGFIGVIAVLGIVISNKVFS